MRSSMPTTTSILTKQPLLTTHVPLKSSKLSSSPPDSSPSQTSTSATLRSLYPRAARAFVLRDIETTHYLLQSAFSILKPPSSTTDSLSDDRKKWDILRITFESTVYSSPPDSTASWPESLRSILTEAPQALVTAIYSRSLSLFTPSGTKGKTALNAACLPPQVLTTLVYSSLKLGVPDVGRMIIEDWLSRREPLDVFGGVRNRDGYDKVLELYILHILPKIGQWDYAKEFLEYESELPAARRDNLKSALSKLLKQSRPPSEPSSSSPPSASNSQPTSPRSYSPALSTSSSSSVSTTSTRTVVPATVTPRGRSLIGISSLSSQKLPTPSAASSSVLNGNAVPQSASTSIPNGHHPHRREPTPAAAAHSQLNHHRPRSKSRTHSSTSSGYSNLPRSRVAHKGSPSALSLVKASLTPYLTKPRITTFILLFVFVPLMTFILRMRRRRRQATLGPLASAAGPLSIGVAAGSASAAVSNAELVKRRLHGPSAAESGIVGKAWNEIVRVVGDTVRMAGSGLV